MFRNHVDGNRDMYLARSRDGVTFEPAAKVGQGTWKLGRARWTVARRRLSSAQPITAWRREKGIFIARPNEAECRVGTGRDPAVAAAGPDIDLVWTGADGLMLMRGDDNQSLGARRFPVLLAFDGYTLIAWKNQGQVLVRRVPR